MRLYSYAFVVFKFTSTVSEESAYPCDAENIREFFICHDGRDPRNSLPRCTDGKQPLCCTFARCREWSTRLPELNSSRTPFDDRDASCPPALLAVPQPIVLKIAIRWEMFGDWDDKRGLVSGSMGIRLAWSQWQFATIPLGDSALPADADIRDVVHPVNFLEGKARLVNVGEPMNWFGSKIGSKYFVGDWQQSFDGTCYPFDEQVVRMEFTLLNPLNKFMVFHLFCPDGDQDYNNPHSCVEDTVCEAYDATGHKLSPGTESYFLSSTVVKLVDPSSKGRESNGFTWSEFVCELTTSYKITCSMKAQRQVWKVLTKLWLPAALMNIVSWLSFFMPVHYSMHRVSTTMISLLCFISMHTATLNSVPEKGTSWLEEFYLFGILIMMANMIGHVIAFHYTDKSLHTRKVFERLSLYFWSPIYWLIVVGRLWVRDCPGVSNSLLLLPMILLSLWAVSAFFTLFWKEFRDVKNWRAKRNSERENQASRKTATETDETQPRRTADDESDGMEGMAL